jgi:hypothetical protein
MNRNRAKELLPIIQAFADGKAIQFRVSEDYPWSEGASDCLTFGHDMEYRIKPESMELWVIFDKDGDMVEAMLSCEGWDKAQAEEHYSYYNDPTNSHTFGPYTLRHFKMTETP